VSLQDTEKHKGRPAVPEKQESELSQGKPKSKKLLNAKKEIPTDVKGR
jgi:hypothetical protein